MLGGLDVDDIILNFDPAAPHARFRAAGLELLEAALPRAVPWRSPVDGSGPNAIETSGRPRTWNSEWRRILALVFAFRGCIAGRKPI